MKLILSGTTETGASFNIENANNQVLPYSISLLAYFTVRAVLASLPSLGLSLYLDITEDSTFSCYSLSSSSVLLRHCELLVARGLPRYIRPSVLQYLDWFVHNFFCDHHLVFCSCSNINVYPGDVLVQDGNISDADTLSDEDDCLYGYDVDHPIDLTSPKHSYPCSSASFDLDPLSSSTQFSYYASLNFLLSLLPYGVSMSIVTSNLGTEYHFVIP